MLFLLLLFYVVVALVLGNFAWNYALAKYGRRKVDDFDGVFFFGALFWIIAVPAVIIVVLLWHPATWGKRLGAKLGARAAVKVKA